MISRGRFVIIYKPVAERRGGPMRGRNSSQATPRPPVPSLRSNMSAYILACQSGEIDLCM
jgi:hypothetical protein